ncbi:MAG: hypothetical protein AAFN78_01015 [Pseudomonadota bacterium]
MSHPTFYRQPTNDQEWSEFTRAADLDGAADSLSSLPRSDAEWHRFLLDTGLTDVNVNLPRSNSDWQEFLRQAGII